MAGIGDGVVEEGAVLSGAFGEAELMGDLNRKLNGSYRSGTRIHPGNHDLDILGMCVTHPDEDHKLRGTILLTPTLIECKSYDALRPVKESGASRLHCEPFLPIVAFMFSLFKSPQECSSIIGDLQERHGLILKAEGPQAATRWFWWEVIASLFSLAVEALRMLSRIEELIERYRRIGF